MEKQKNEFLLGRTDTEEKLQDKGSINNRRGSSPYFEVCNTGAARWVMVWWLWWWWWVVCGEWLGDDALFWERRARTADS